MHKHTLPRLALATSMLFSACSSNTSASEPQSATPSASPSPAVAAPATPAPSAPSNRVAEPAPSAVVSPEPAPSVPPAAVAPEPPPSTPPAAVEGIHLTRVVLAQGVQDREPTGEATSFSAGTKVYVFLEIENDDGAPYSLNVRFEKEGATKPGKGIPLAIPSMKRYRTHAFFNNTKSEGRYHCIITTDDGTLVSDTAFDITPSEATRG